MAGGLRRTRMARLLPTAALAFLTTVTACGGGTSAKTQPVAGPADLVPAQVRSGGVLRVASDIEYAPNEFFDAANRPKGLDYDLAAEIARRLKLRLQFDNVAWDGIIPAVQQGREDLLMSSMTDTAERQKSLAFVDYFVAGSQVLVRAGDPHAASGLSGLCGHSVAIQSGTTHIDIAGAQSRSCVRKHQPPIRVVQVASGATVTSVSSRRTDAAIDDYPVVAYAVQQHPSALALAGRQVEAAPYGIGLAKSSVALRGAVQAALEQMDADGTYARILSAWHITGGSLTTAALDGGA